MNPNAVNDAEARVIVVGGGLAGMSAAVALESAGVNVTLLEARRRLGGRAGSFEDPQSGEELDNCQHVLLGCCTNLLDFYKRLGVSGLIRRERTIHFRTPGGSRYDLYGMRGLPAPLHLARALARFGALTWRERAVLAGAMVAMMRLDDEARLRLADMSFGQWLDDHYQPVSLVRKLYDPIIISGLNELTRQVSAAAAIQVFVDSLLRNAGGYVMGMPGCTLSRLYEKIPCGDVCLGARVRGLEIDASGVRGVQLVDGQRLEADAVVLATNHHAVNKWVPQEWLERDERFGGLAQLKSVPILGAHLWFDRSILKESHAALLSGPLQWVFRKDQAGRALHGVISAAESYADQDREELLKEFEAQIRAYFPEAAEARLDRGVIVIEKRATFSPLPGIERHRPMQTPIRGGLQRLYLAGDYTQTGWPATMEGAVRSGYLAAEGVMRALTGRSRRFVVNDLPAQWPARVMNGAW